ncbi:MAG: phosphoenolpyruvate--protein phosphotransferase [Syntrophales bacterium]|jgi:phosphotransferase system enzyme I (PtsP)|nr:phosphoenolpyruvate--protein phosphotransferase [Syntrophales bacterium]MCK9527220.1 phosphoenolpyruvate--protein phosphotransferase [Syntrophales bacterium]MDX9921310.1 phosphoenolpyruvate--protein phosphotransferase [Syntrophales bacterium]
MMEKNEGNHLSMLCDMSEIASLLAGSENMESFFNHTVTMVAEHLRVPVCSIYLYDDETRELVLKATLGLNPRAVGKVRMKRGEGLVGTAMDTLDPVLEGSARTSKNYLYFEEADEDMYESFLAVPIGRGDERIGVIVVQHEQRDYFNQLDVTALRGIASQLAGVIANARLLMSIERQPGPTPMEEIFRRLRFVKGKSGSEGYAHGLSAPFDKRNSLRLYDAIPPDEDRATREDFFRSLKETSDQLEDLQGDFFQRLPEAASLIFDAHHLILKDEGFSRRVMEHMDEGKGAAESVRLAALYYIKAFSSSNYGYLREKVVDIEDLGLRIIENLLPTTARDSYSMAGRIVIADVLYPSDILWLAAEEVRGAVLVGGGTTSHIAILSRSLQLPLVITDNRDLLVIPRGTSLLVDADLGDIYVNPSPAVISSFRRKKETRLSLEKAAAAVTDTTVTRDGEPVEIMANINLLGELPLARGLKARGVGLYRTEFPFLVRSGLPSEEEQYAIYRRVFAEMEGRPVVIRTLDLAGDKVLPYMESCREENPQLGLRSIRFLFENRDIFEHQVRAILRAAADVEKVGILFPLISSIDEFEEARRCVESCMTELERQKLPHHRSPALGPMVELPALVEIIDEMAREADFASIGTNDLVQYMLAADRANDRVIRYYQPWHPAVLRGLEKIVKAFNKRGKGISLCGELAHECNFIPFLVGIGIRVLSVDPRFIPSVQKCLKETDLAEARRFALAVLAESTVKGVLGQVRIAGNNAKAETFTA